MIPAQTTPVYLDYNATTPVDKRVLDKMLPYFTTQFGNPSSAHHRFGWETQEAVEDARYWIAELVHAKQQEIFFTSGATESINLALKGVAERYRNKGTHIITTAIEHSAVRATCRQLQKNGFRITNLSVDKEGNINLDELEQTISSDTILIVIMYAHNVMGTVYPIPAIGKIARQHEVLFFTDAAQALGKIPVNMQQDYFDLAAISSHKIYGPKGVGALVLRNSFPPIDIKAQIDGGGQERGLRSGTLNVPGIVGFGEAARIALEEMSSDSQRISTLRDKLEYALLAKLPDTFVNGNRTSRLPNTTNIAFQHITNTGLLNSIPSLALSIGSACSSSKEGSTDIFKAQGIEDRANSSVRFSLGKYTSVEEIDYTISVLIETIIQMRNSQRHG